jgi:hypothetical protein
MVNEAFRYVKHIYLGELKKLFVARGFVEADVYALLFHNYLETDLNEKLGNNSLIKLTSKIFMPEVRI